MEKRIKKIHVTSAMFEFDVGIEPNFLLITNGA